MAEHSLYASKRLSPVIGLLTAFAKTFMWSAGVGLAIWGMRFSTFIVGFLSAAIVLLITALVQLGSSILCAHRVNDGLRDGERVVVNI